MLKLGQIVVTEGGSDFWGKVLRWGMQSRWTHCFIVTGIDEIVEAELSGGVRTYSLKKRREELRLENRTLVSYDVPMLNRSERIRIAAQAKSYVGRPYDIITGAFWFLFGRFYHHGKRQLMCSRLVTAAYQDAIGMKLFDRRRLRGLEETHKADLMAGYCTPDDLVRYSTLRKDSQNMGF